MQHRHIFIFTYPVPVEITSPSGTSIHVNHGDSFTLRCRGDTSSELSWYVNGTLIALLPGHFEINADGNPNSGHKVVLLKKTNVRRQDTGTYTCKDNAINDDGDSILVMVEQNGKYDLVYLLYYNLL